MNPELRERITSAAVALCESARVLIASTYQNIRQDASGGFEAEKPRILNHMNRSYKTGSSMQHDASRRITCRKDRFSF